VKKLPLLSLIACGLFLLNACGGGGSTTLQPPPPAATHFSISAPTNATAGAAFNFTVNALDASNNVVASYSGTVHFTSADTQATLPANSTLTNGTGTFSVTLNTAGGQSITATDTVTASLTGNSNTINVSAPATATRFIVTAPLTATTGTPFNLTVRALDASNNVVATYSGTVHFTSTDTQAMLPPNSKLTNGAAILQATLRTDGGQTITATDTLRASITGTSNTINASGPATHLSVTAPASAIVGTAFDLTVTALDASDNVATGYSGTLHFTSTDVQADLPEDSMLTKGTANLPASLKTVSVQTITATDTVTASITGTTSSINVSLASAANPVPLINQPLSPNAVLPGGSAFTLTVNGTGFVSGSLVKWNGSAPVTSFVSNSKLKAMIPATDIASFNTASVTVVNPSPGGGTSNVVFFETTRATSSVSLSITSELATGSSPLSVATGDFNGDGKLDLAVANSGSGNNVSILLGNGDGTFKPAVDYGAGSGPYSVAVGDFNGDGKLDLVVANTNSNNVSILLGNGDGTFQPAVDYGVGSEPRAVAVGDFNGDGKLDLAVANTGSSNVSVLLGNGDGTFQPAFDFSTGFGQISLAVGDFNGDGNLDLAVVNFGTGNVSVLLGDGDGTFEPAVNYVAGVAPVSVSVGDFNGDGKLDLAVANIAAGNIGPGSVSVLLGNGDGTFQPAVNYGVGPNPNFVAVGDLNGDANLDLVVANTTSNNVSILLGNGDGTFQPAVDYDSGSVPYSVAVGDFNGDGRLDMAVADASSSTVSVLLQPGLVSGPSGILSPPALTFATQLVGTTSPAQSVLLTNYGTATLSITGITASGDFLRQSDTCGSSLAAGASCTISVTFTPTASGTRSGTLSVADNAPGTPQTASLSGTGTVVTLSPNSLKFACIPEPIGHCTCFPLSQATTLTNIGNTALDITGIAVTGPFSQTNTCPANLPAGQSCAITVHWSRSAGGGVLTVSDNGGGSPQSVSLSGVLLCHPLVSSSAASASGSAACGGR
jgi:FG-GAP-like repeat/Abnormal spindle-like microcephaly-assoc'd, ASPM-SPD-2-Hydin/FG-GAP repeat